MRVDLNFDKIRLVLKFLTKSLRSKVYFKTTISITLLFVKRHS